MSHPAIGHYFPGAGLDWAPAGCEGETDPIGVGDAAEDADAEADGTAEAAGVADAPGWVETDGDTEAAAVVEA